MAGKSKRDSFQPPKRTGKSYGSCECCGGTKSPGHKCPPGMERKK